MKTFQNRHEVVVYERFQFKALTGKFLVLWKGGRLQEGVADGGSAAFQSLYNSYITCKEV